MQPLQMTPTGTGGPLAGAQVSIREVDPAALQRATLPEDAYSPFPVDALPDPLRTYVVTGASAMGCAVEYAAMPMLALLGGVIGNSLIARLEDTWWEPAIIWATSVGPPSERKTPAFKLAMEPAREMQWEAVETYEQELEQYNRTQAKKTKGQPPVEVPAPEQLIYDNVTMEALAVGLKRNPRGGILAQDELSRFFLDMNVYRSGKGGDEQLWLSMWSAEPMTINRKTGIAAERFIAVKRATMSIAGNIQQQVLRSLADERTKGKLIYGEGMMARMLFSMPPAERRFKSGLPMDAEVRRDVRVVLRRLHAIPYKGEPMEIGLAPDAASLFAKYTSAIEDEKYCLDDDLGAAWGKLVGYTARIALVIHAASRALSLVNLDRRAGQVSAIPPPNIGDIDVSAVGAAIKLIEYFKVQTRRVYAMISETAAMAEARNIIRIAKRNPRRSGALTRAELARASRRYPTVAEAEKAMNDYVVQQGLARWEPLARPQGGSETKEMVLADVDK